jgi:phage gp36-like protein
MSNYLSTSQIRTRLDLPNISEQIEQLSHTTNIAAQDAMLELFMEEACGLIDAYLDGSYTVPITTTANNAFLRGVASDLAVHEIFKRGSGDEVPTKYRKNYEDAIRTLEDLAEGLITVPGVGSDAQIKNTSVDVSSDTTVFTEEKLARYF